MEKNNKIQHGMLRASIGLMMLSGALCIHAQETTDEVAPVKPAKTAKPAPTYEMKEVSGYVYDAATKAPIDGARVQAYGNTRYSVMTDENGKYTLKVPVFVNSLYITVPEFNDAQVGFDGKEAPKVALYSSKYNDVYAPTTSITAKSVAKLENSSAVIIDEEIENKLSGDIHTINRTGMRGQGAAMFIRGLNSINTNAQPLFVLDGMIIDPQLERTGIHDGFFNNILAGIDPEDVESIEVLKNATSLYGVRGANGVVLINTKRGHSMATKINVNINAGFELAPSLTPMMNASQYRNYVSEFIGSTDYGKENGTASTAIKFMNSDPTYYWYPMYHNETNWSNGLYHDAATQNYKVNVQGGDEVAMYTLSMGYTNSKSTAKENSFDRLNVRFNTDIKLIKNISTQLDLAYSKVTYNLRDNGWAESYANSTVSSPNVLGLIQSPSLSKYSYYNGEDGKLHQSSVYSGKYISDDNYPFDFGSLYVPNSALANPYWILENGDGTNKNRQENTQFNLNIMPKWEINEHLTLTNRFAYQLNRSNEKYYLPKMGIPTYNLEGYGDVTSAVKSLFSKETALYEEMRLNWMQNFNGIHDVQVFGGFRLTVNTFSNSYMHGYNAGNDKMPDMQNSLAFRKVDGTQEQWKNLAYYVHGRWGIKNTYYLEGTLTAETSSRFGTDTKDGIKLFGVKWGIFPNLQAGWIITNEKWMPKNENVNLLKLTAGYDEAGNDNIDYSLSRTYFKSQTFLKTATGLGLANIENPSIQWEVTRSWNIGLNGSFFKNRIQAGVDVYFRNTSNLLTRQSINYLSGLQDYYTNSGSLRNTGVDVKLNAIVLNLKDFKFQVGATMGHYKNKICSLPEYDPSILNERGYTTTIYGGEVLTAVGRPAGVFYGYKTEGVFATTEAAEAANLQYPTGDGTVRYFTAGDIQFSDLNNDHIIDEKDRTVIGDPNPDIYGTIYANLSYKHWSLDINFKYSVGNDIYNYQRSRLEAGNNLYNQTTAVVNRWTYETQVTDVPKVISPTSDLWVNNERFSDRWIEDGSYLKLKKVRLTYELPLNLSWLQGLTIYGEANNLFTLTKYTAKDPEFSCSNSILYQGIDAGLLPSNRSFHLGVKINL